MNASYQSFHRWTKDGRLFAILSAAGFSLKAVFVKLGYAAGPVDALTLLTLRMGLALPLFIWLIWLSRDEERVPLSRIDCLWVLLLGIFGYYLSSLFDFYGLEYISAGLERLILYLYPTLVLIFQAIIARRKPSSRMLQAIVVCYFGLSIAFIHDVRVIGPSTHVMTGAAWVFASAVTYAVYYLGTGAMVKRLGSMRLAGLAGASSSMLVLAHYAWSGSPVPLAALPSSVWIYAALMALLSTALPIYWMALAIQRMGSVQAAVIGSLGPVLTVFAAWGLLDEAPTFFQVAGLVLVMLGVARLKPRLAGASKHAPVGRTIVQQRNTDPCAMLYASNRREADKSSDNIVSSSRK